MHLTRYTQKSIVLHGNTKDHKDALKDLGGKWSQVLRARDFVPEGKGWLFPVTRLAPEHADDLKKVGAVIVVGDEITDYIVPKGSPGKGKVKAASEAKVPDLDGLIQKLDDLGLLDKLADKIADRVAAKLQVE